MTSNTFRCEVSSGERFDFGKNWSSFLNTICDHTIENAQASFKAMLGLQTLSGLRFLDAGSGSGLSSLVARRLGADVISFDFDPNSVACTNSLRAKYASEDDKWRVLEGSVLDERFVKSLGEFDIVYSWGVLHHTGKMWKALETVATAVKDDGLLFIMIYADHGFKSKVWRFVKKTYCSNPLGRAAVLGTFIPYFVLRGAVEDLCRIKNPKSRYREYSKRRGMSKYHDWIDWLGGYPYETANFPEIRSFLKQRGFILHKHCGQESVFRRAKKA